MKFFQLPIILGVAFIMGVSGPVKAENWMSELPDVVPVRELSIPGSHDAGTGNGFSGLSAIAAAVSGVTQSFDLSAQWDAGVRAFDLRPTYKSSADGKLQIYHGSLETKVSMKAALQTMVEKLEVNPGEMAVILMRHENDGDNNSAEWAPAMSNLLTEFDAYIAEFHPDMTLGETRGKIIVLSRDGFTSAKAGMISGWSHSENFDDQIHASISLSGSTAPLYCQDFYDCQTADRKYADVVAMLDYSIANTAASTWVINHTSGYTGGSGTNTNVRNLAKDINKRVCDYLDTSDAGRTGIVMMDFAGANKQSNTVINGDVLVSKIIAQNDRYISSGTTSVEAPAVSDAITGNDCIYDLAGRCIDKGADKLQSLPKGVYILNGRKIIR